MRAPPGKTVQVRAALLFIAGQRRICVKALRALLGMWLWLAFVRRELLSIPQNISKLIDTCADTEVVWWPSARRETVAMARSVLAMYTDMGAPVPNVIVAMYAMGADGTSDDHGG